ncbi:MAG: Flp pilus assembly complex ATPase component TadA [Planctomycetes bacterium]|nr:Flp pilus assembly complex ATPase component TadA [Planctomycetota bacterium]
MAATETPSALAGALAQILRDIESADLDRLLRGIPEEVGRVLGASEARLYLKDPLTEELYCRSGNGKRVVEHRIPIAPSSAAGYAALTRGRAFAWKKNRNLRRHYVAAAPLLFQDEIDGVIEIVNAEEETPVDEPRIAALLDCAAAMARRHQTLLRAGVRRSPYDRLLRSGLLTPETLEGARRSAREQGRSVEALLAEGGIDRHEIGLSLAEHFECRFVDPAAGPAPDPGLLRPFPPDFLRTHAALPLSRSADVVEVAVANPRNVTLLDDLARILGTRDLVVRVSIREDIAAAIDRFLVPAEPMRKETTRRIAPPEPSPAEEPARETEHSLAGEVEDSWAVRFVNETLLEAVRRNASDVHLEPTPGGGLLVRFRVDGVCHEYRNVQERCARAVVSRIKIMSELDIAEHRLPQDGKARLRDPEGRKLDVRVAVVPTQGGMEDMVLRLLPEFQALKIEDLGMAPAVLERFRAILEQPNGIVLSVGPTGSGKTTTLHAALAHLKRPETKIWTAEDPVEITQEGLRQVQVNPKIGLTFERCLRAFLRCDPDVIMIGEIRDRETADAAVEASLTGHLVLSTLHTNSAPETVTRLLEMGLDPYTFGDTLLGVLAQRLVRRICDGCRETYRPPRDEFESLRTHYGDDAEFRRLVPDPGSLELVRGKGCARCFETGYRGRVGVHELLAVTDEVRKLVHQKAESARIRRLATDAGMRLLKQDGIRKVVEGKTDLREVLSNCADVRA